MSRPGTLLATGLLLPQFAWASDYSALMPFYIAVVALIGGIAAGFEWVLIKAVMDRGPNAGDEDPESRNQSRFGCGVGVALWIVNSFIAHRVIVNVWS